MIFTKKIVVFALHEEVLDLIPMHEIAMVQDSLHEKQGEDTASEIDESNMQDSDDDDKESRLSMKNAFILKTIDGGYNSGRKYSVRTKKGQEMRFVVQDITRLAAVAREDAEAKSRMKKFQEKIARVFDSDVVQRILAIMIFSVRIGDFNNFNCIRLVYLYFAPID